MAKITHEKTIAERIYDTYKRNGRMSNRLGASIIGTECERALWYGFRWCAGPDFSGRMLRLFQRGHREEEVLVKNLRDIGYIVHEVDPETGYQFELTERRGHFVDYIDGCLLGVHEAPTTWHVLEMKTTNDKGYKALVKSGVEVAQPKHYAQCMAGMGLTGMTRALYISVNKNDDNIYTERIRYDAKFFKLLMAKAKRIIESPEPPERMSGAKPAFFKCKWCDFNSICFAEKMPGVNCRTCAFSTPIEGAEWCCEKTDTVLSAADQKAGCKKHCYIPPLIVGWEPVEYKDYITYKKDDMQIANGPYDYEGDSDDTIKYTSKELELLHPDLIGHEAINRCKAMFDGVVVDSENLEA